MHFETVGINYKTTPVAMRSKVAIGSQQLEEALNSLHQQVPQGIILSTCNRLEIYSLVSEKENTSGSIAFLQSRSGLSTAELQPHIYQYADREAVRHLFRVASGLDSMIIGEYEILGQVKQALQAAQKSTAVNSPLLELFRRAMICGRKVRVKTEISKNALSVSSVSVDLAMRVARDMKHSRILVVGAGEAGQQVARTCRGRGATQITVVSRSSTKGGAFARAIQGTWRSMENLEAELVNQDIVICCSGAPHTVLKTDMVRKAMKLRSGRPQVIIDIGVPCNVDPDVKNLEQVFLHNIDELTAICQANHRQRFNEVSQAEKIVDAETEKFMAYWHELKVKPLITALLDKAEDIRQARLKSAFKQAPELSAEERAKIEALSKSIVQKMLHEPIQCLKANHKNEDYLRIVNELFCLDKNS